MYSSVGQHGIFVAYSFVVSITPGKCCGLIRYSLPPQLSDHTGIGRLPACFSRPCKEVPTMRLLDGPLERLHFPERRAFPEFAPRVNSAEAI